MNRLLSLDTSTTSSGWAYFEGGEYVDSGVIQINTKDTSKRLKQMILLLFEYIDHYSPTTVIIETPAVVRNPQTQRLLTMIFGAIYGKCVVDNIEFCDLRPTQWRSLVDSEKKPRKRDELKEWSKNKVKLLFGKNVTDDESDSI